MENTNLAILVLGAVVLILLAVVLLSPSPISQTIVLEEEDTDAGETTEPTEETQGTEEIPEAETEDEKEPEIVVIETSKGTIEVELDRESAPVTVENFATYVNEGFYDGTVFHRVINGFMVQGGGFTPEGTQKETHPPIILESSNGLKNKRGTVAMARTMDPDSATSQFFISVADNSFLDYSPGNPGYAVFGKVVSGMDTVDKIKEVETTSKYGMGDWPTEDVLILKVYMKN